jgi:hypothetical protein
MVGGDRSKTVNVVRLGAAFRHESNNGVLMRLPKAKPGPLWRQSRPRSHRLGLHATTVAHGIKDSLAILFSEGF